MFKLMRNDRGQVFKDKMDICLFSKGHLTLDLSAMVTYIGLP